MTISLCETGPAGGTNANAREVSLCCDVTLDCREEPVSKKKGGNRRKGQKNNDPGWIDPQKDLLE